MEFTNRNKVEQHFDDGSVPSQQTDFSRWRAEISDAADRVREIGIHLGAFVDELYGPVPEPIGKPAEQTEPNCQVAALDREIVRLLAGVTEIEDKYRRLRRLA